MHFLMFCKQKLSDTTIDKCKFANWEIFEKKLFGTDRIPFDLKHLELIDQIGDKAINNDLILENLDEIFKTIST